LQMKRTSTKDANCRHSPGILALARGLQAYIRE
jgi:hypothetical protein